MACQQGRAEIVDVAVTLATETMVEGTGAVLAAADMGAADMVGADWRRVVIREVPDQAPPRALAAEKPKGIIPAATRPAPDMVQLRRHRLRRHPVRVEPRSMDMVRR